MIKTLAAANKSERVKVKVPRSVQQSIPIKRIYTNGIWEVGNKHSRSWKLTDVNYIAASHETRESIFSAYCGALNSMPTDATAKITIVNHRLNPAEFERRILFPYKDDWLDHYREEANGIMKGRAAQSNNLVQERFVTLSIPKRKIQESKTYFRRAGANLQKTFSRLDSGITPARNYDRLRVLHDFFRPGYEQYFDYDDYRFMQTGKDFRDLICPDSISFKRNHFEFGDKFGRVLFLRTYASFLTDDLISDLTEYARDLILSIDMIPVPTDEAVKEVESIILGVETDITRWQQRQNSKNNFTAEVPRTMEQKRENSRGFMDDLTQNDQRMIFSLITIVHTADSMEELDADTESLIAIGKEHLCDISPARFQQEDGLNTALPYGLRRIHALNTLTTESCAVAIPFRAQEIQDPSGLSYGINEVSKNPIVCDRKLLSSPHAFYLGISGSGKSMGMKSTIMNVALGTDDDIIIVDAEREYGTLARAFGGEVVEISPNSNHHLNPLEIPAGYEDENPVAQKSELIMSILEQQMGTGSISGSYKSIIDRCTANIYRPYLKGKAPAPLLSDWRNEVMRQPEQEARELALTAELITEGSLNVFAHATDVDMGNRIIVLDLYEMGDSLRKTALVVTLEAIQNRVMENRKRGKFTWVFIDEVYLYFKYHYSAEVLYKAWKRFRKYGGILTAATQNVEECLTSDTARLMFANSEFLMLFNQAATEPVNLLSICAITLVLYKWSSTLTVYILLFTVVQLAITLMFRRPVRRSFSSLRSNEQLISTSLGMHFQIIDSIKIFGLEDYSHKEFQKNFHTLNNAVKKNNILTSMYSTIVSLINQIWVLGLVVFGAKLSSNQHLTVGSFMGIFMLSNSLYAPLSSFVETLLKFEETNVSFNRYLEYYNKYRIEEYSGNKPFEFEHKLTLFNLTFSYDQNNILIHNLTFSFPKSAFVLVKGESGSGKTTFAKLLSRLLYPSSGKITIDNNDLLDFEYNSLRAGICFLTQKPILISDTVLKNVFLSKKVDRVRFWKIMDDVGLTETIKRLPEKENSLLGYKGVEFSEGEKQRLSLARTLIQRPAILIVDEPTSALDEKNKCIISQTLADYQFTTNCLLFVISHDIVFDDMADYVMDFSHGRVTVQKCNANKY